MEEIFLTARFVKFKYADLTPKRRIEMSHFQILQQLSNKDMFPKLFIELLENLETDEDRNALSKKFVKIYLYASTIIHDTKKLHDWLLKGSLPQTISNGFDSMNLLTQNIKKISSLKKLQEREIDKIEKAKTKNSDKPSKRSEDKLQKNQDRLLHIESQFKQQKEQIENIILEIEMSLASGRKL